MALQGHGRVEGDGTRVEALVLGPRCERRSVRLRLALSAPGAGSAESLSFGKAKGIDFE